jgi:hypothetical protein
LSAQEFRFGLRDDFIESSWTQGEILSEPTKVGQGVVHAAGQANPAVALVPEGFLEETKEALAARDGNCHGSEFAEDLLQLLQRDTFLRRGNFVEDLKKAILAMLRQLKRHEDCIDNPAKNEFPGVPISISLLELLGTGRFLAMFLVKFV